MKLRTAFVGFHHGHIFDLLAGVRELPEFEVVAACEESPDIRESLKNRTDLTVTHTSFTAMLEQVECDVVAIGDYYTKRGRLAIKALESGKHVISDKPLCTDLEELERIEALSGSSGLAVGCQFDLRGSGPLLTVRNLIAQDEIGEIQTISFSGQHPLLLGSRPAWYFQPSCHGGTINDIAVHAADAIGWLTGRTIARVTAARAWNARTPQFPHFQDAAQMMFQLDNQGGVLGDVSYLAPDGCGYSIPQYWRFVFHGSKGVIETHYQAEEVWVANREDKAIRSVKAEKNVPWPYLPDFLMQVRDKTAAVTLSTANVLRASRITLIAQNAADRNQRNVPC